MDKLLSPTDLAEELGDLPPATLAQWRYRGVGPPYLTIGRHVRYRRADVDAWIEAQYNDLGGAA